MFLPRPFNTIECQSTACDFLSSCEALLQKFLDCSRKKFSGYLALTLRGNDTTPWNFYFLNGRLVGSQGGVHPVRCWYRQIIRYCPQLSCEFPSQTLGSAYLWDYSALSQRVEQGQISRGQKMAVIRGFLIETLFDFMQACQFRDRASTIKLVHYDCSQKMTLSPPIGFHPSDIWQQTVQVWTAWNRAGLAQHSPNLTPIIQDAETLRRQTSPTVYQNLTQRLNSERTIRDLAIQIKQHALLLMRSLLPYVRQGIIRLVTVTDIAVPAYPTDNVAAQPLDGQTKRPLVAYLEDSRFDCMAMGQILRQAGYRFTGMSDPLQALPQIIEQKPDLIFLDVLMPVLNGYEVCARIRQISAFKHTPVIFVTSCDGIADRARAKLLGASGFLTKPITSEKVLANLWNYLLKSASPPIQPINQGPQSLVSPPTPIRRSRGKVIEEGRRIQAFT